MNLFLPQFRAYDKFFHHVNRILSEFLENKVKKNGNNQGLRSRNRGEAEGALALPEFVGSEKRRRQFITK